MIQINLKELYNKLRLEKITCTLCGNADINLKRNYNISHYYLIPYVGLEEDYDLFLFWYLDNENYVSYSEFYDANTNNLLKTYIYDKFNYLTVSKTLERHIRPNMLECRFFQESPPHLTEESLEKT